MTDFSYWIGVDHREPEALAVAQYSAQSLASKPLPVHYLEHLDLRQRNYFNRPWRIAEDGGYWDERDGKPFSVQFSHTRFLTPLLARDAGYKGWALFTDCDWLWLEDPFKLLAEADTSKTVMVVPHRYMPTNSRKMDNRPQASYGRKLWSALALWNLSSPLLPPLEMVNEADGGYLHRFGWLPDEEIGFLSESWHWVSDASPTTVLGEQAEAENRPLPINAVHFTSGLPIAGMTHRAPTPFDELWHNEQKIYLNGR